MRKMGGNGEEVGREKCRERWVKHEGENKGKCEGKWRQSRMGTWREKGESVREKRRGKCEGNGGKSTRREKGEMEQKRGKHEGNKSEAKRS